MNNKKFYEAPSAELYCLSVQEELLTGSSITAEGGFTDRDTDTEENDGL